MLSQLLHSPLTAEKLKSISDLKLTKEQQVIVDQIIADNFPVPETKRQNLNVKLYQALYPYLALAYSFEQNGIIEEHTQKLATLFDNAKDALQYLRDFHGKNKNNNQFVHDACLFTLPESKNFNVWKKLAKKHLLDETFKKLLGISGALEKQIAKDQKEKHTLMVEVYNRHAEIKAEKPPLSSMQIQSIKQKINKEIKEKNDFCKRFKARHNQMRQDESKVAMNVRYLAELDELHNDRAILHLEKSSLGQYSVADFIDVNHRLLKLENSWARKFFLAQGIALQYYNQFAELDRSKAGKNIPDIGILECGDGFYMKKLHVADENEGVIGACLGKLTHCCQSLSGETGMSCTLHGLTHPDSGFYVLFKGDAKNPKLTDTVYGQTWVNRTSSDALLFDSIESAQGAKDAKDCAVVSQAFRHLATHLVKQQAVSRVQAGLLTGISLHVSFQSTYQLTAEPPKDYQGHLDSSKQGLLAHSQLLGTFNEKNKFAIDAKAIRHEFKNSPEISEKIRFTIGFLLQNKLPLKSFLKNIPKDKIDSIKKYITLQKNFIKALSQTHRLSVFIKNSINKKLPIDINLTSENGYTALTQATRLKDKELIQLLLQEKAKIDVPDSHYEHLTPLAEAAHSGDIDMVTFLLEAKATINSYDTTPALIKATSNNHIEMIDLLIKNKADVNLPEPEVGDTALLNTENIDVIKRLIQEKANVNAKSFDGRHALATAALKDRPDIAQILLEAKASVFDQANDDSPGFITWAAKKGYTEIVQALFDAKATINQTNDNKRALIEAINNKHTNIIDILLERKVDVNMMDGNTNALLSATAKQDLLLVKKLIEAKANVNAQNDEKQSPFFVAVENSNLDLVKYFLEQTNLDLDKINSHGDTPLDVAVLKEDRHMMIELIYCHTARNIPKLKSFLETQLKLFPSDPDLQKANVHFKKFYFDEKPKVKLSQFISSGLHSMYSRFHTEEQKDSVAKKLKKPTGSK